MPPGLTLRLGHELVPGVCVVLGVSGLCVWCVVCVCRVCDTSLVLSTMVDCMCVWCVWMAGWCRTVVRHARLRGSCRA